ncbi:MAG TPA: Do family serine endopeptidase [Acidocella sp.]|jgi:serine protease Do|nr:Do family serine endopeptidase [Acidocella sp.]
MSHKINRGTAIALALLGATALGSMSAGTALAAPPPALNGTAAVQSSFTPFGDFTSLVKRVTPAVVSIDVHLKLDQMADNSGSGDGHSASGLLPGRPFGGSQNGPAEPQPVEAKGAGFIINPAGIVVTNNHVIKDAQTISVSLSGGKSYPATLIGTDLKTDLAVLKINAGHPLPYVELGSSKEVEPGQFVVAVGNPFGLGGTVTTGIVSALGRDIGDVDGPYDRFIQIDAPINEGNSGGPLFNLRGEVIGINTAIISPTGGSVGIAFAIPSDMVRRITTQLVNNGKVTRGYLGIAGEPISLQMAQAMGLPTAAPASDGALIAAISTDGPAARAGLKPGDVVTAVNGMKVTNPNDLATDIANVDPGDKTNITYMRDGQPHDLLVALAAMPENPTADFQEGGNVPAAARASHAALGLTLAPLTPGSRSELNLPSTARGAVVAQVSSNSLADQAGLQPDDLLVGVGSQDVTSPDGAVAALDAAGKSGAQAVMLRIMRQGAPLFVGIGLKNSPDGH